MTTAFGWPNLIAATTDSALVITIVSTTPTPATRMVALVSANRTQLATWSMAWKAPSAGRASAGGDSSGRGSGRLRSNASPVDGPLARDAPFGEASEPVCGPRGGGGGGVLGRVPVGLGCDARVAADVHVGRRPELAVDVDPEPLTTEHADERQALVAAQDDTDSEYTPARVDGAGPGWRVVVARDVVEAGERSVHGLDVATDLLLVGPPWIVPDVDRIVAVVERVVGDADDRSVFGVDQAGRRRGDVAEHGSAIDGDVAGHLGPVGAEQLSDGHGRTP